MTELRWLRVHGSQNRGQHPSAIADHREGYMRVLQYREPLHVPGSLGISEVAYGEWRDIPIVEAAMVGE